MNMEEYRRRIDSMHTVTGVPTYWEELQDAIAERNAWALNASKWRDLFRQVTADNDISHDSAVVSVEGPFRKLAETIDWEVVRGE